jgi:7-cyano-7-deazaguanine synthase in queuosine biosynthesis
MTIDSQTLTQLAFAALIFFVFRYQQRMWTERCALTQRMAEAEGQLHILKNQTMMTFRGKKETGFWLFKHTVEKSIFVELLEGKPVRVIGDTDDLSAFPDLTKQQLAMIQKLIAAGAAAGAPGASLLVH